MAFGSTCSLLSPLLPSAAPSRLLLGPRGCRDTPFSCVWRPGTASGLLLERHPRPLTPAAPPLARPHRGPRGVTMAVWLFNRLQDSGKPWDDYEATPPPADFPAMITVTDGFKKGVWTYFVVQVSHRDGRVASLERSACSFYRLYRSLALDQRFFAFPRATQSTRYKRDRLRDYLAFLSVRALSAADRARLMAFLSDAAARPESAGDGPAEEGPATEPAEEERAEDDGVVEAPGAWAEPIGLDEAAEADREQVAEVDIFAADPTEPASPGKPPAAGSLFNVPDQAALESPVGVRRVNDVPYREVDAAERTLCEAEAAAEKDDVAPRRRAYSVRGKNLVDIYVPEGACDRPRPVVVHIHGGGWVRGDRKDAFRGAPSFGIAYARAGFVGVTVSYRLSDAPHHIHDCRRAVLWALEHIGAYGGDVARVFISGHSAGGNIAAMLAVSDELGLQPGPAIKGVICVSGVYDIYAPTPTRTKNAIFRRIYVKPTFGGDKGTVPPVALLKNSPSAILRAKLGEPPLPRLCARAANTADCAAEAARLRAAGPLALPPFLLLNASWDLGLELDAVNFAVLLARSAADVRCEVVPATNHADICWSAVAHRKVVDWLRVQLDRCAARAD